MSNLAEIHKDTGPVLQSVKPVPSHVEPSPEPAPAPARRRSWLRTGILLLVAVAAIALGSQWLMARWSQVSVNDARIAASLVTVSSEVSGRVTAIPVTGGDSIEAGALLVSIDSEAARLVLAGVNARLTGLAAQAEQLRTQQDMVRSQVESRLDAGRAQIAAAEATHEASVVAVENAQSRFDRVRELAEREIASTQDEQDVQAALDTARQQEQATAAAVAAARANLAVIEADAEQIAVLESQIATLAAERAALEAERAQKEIDLARREIAAEFDGVVDATFVDMGEYVTPGTRLLIYHRPDEVWVDANVKETDLHNIALGASATITVDAYPGREFHGTVDRIGGATTSQFALLPSPNPSGNFTKVTQRVPIRVAIDTEGEVLSPGMMVELSIDVAD